MMGSGEEEMTLARSKSELNILVHIPSALPDVCQFCSVYTPDWTVHF